MAFKERAINMNPYSQTNHSCICIPCYSKTNQIKEKRGDVRKPSKCSSVLLGLQKGWLRVLFLLVGEGETLT